ncbi:hypothetical protein CBUD_0199a [Coxiella burnetii Dugway 5J108-111]|uniref:Uncharacterized protein n=1 Tax=Coxiella burnetii (strain Dugway 5J108-111) TaxID=434922 RepID=B5XHP0_COXBN|nr:hypothetical protein CBUD_0199a [Coxiella burnetii Dugway 5J108-111]
MLAIRGRESRFDLVCSKSESHRYSKCNLPYLYRWQYLLKYTNACLRDYNSKPWWFP